jgi:uncharacterized hydantoinase/oxoprolinase family protein
MKTKAEIIKETAEFYNLNNRGFNNQRQVCSYVVEEDDITKTCAVGRCMTTEASCKYGSFEGGVDDLESHVDSPIFDDILKEEYRGHSTTFWEDLQSFHDIESNWTATGLSLLGQQNYQHLLIMYPNTP